MANFIQPAIMCRCFRATKWLCAFAAATLLFAFPFGSVTKGQTKSLSDGNAGDPSEIHGSVLNRITREPIGRALVYSPDRQYATLTDDRGHFEFRFHQEPESKIEQPADVGGTLSSFRTTYPRNSRPAVLFAKKPGFLPMENQPFAINYIASTTSEITLYLVPESLIVGHVNIPESEGEPRIRLELYRREMRAGKERWEQVDGFTTWADGEFRFCSLPAGTYKVITTEELDRDPLVFAPEGKLFGYPPSYYPAARDFSTSTPLQVSAGATIQADITVTRHAYYNVKIPVGNAVLGQPMNIQIYPSGHPGPGYSLGYNPNEKEIQGMLPDGNYTLKAGMFGPSTMTGISNFSVNGEPLAGPAINLIPDPSLIVKVKEEFQAAQSNIQQGNSEQPGATKQVNVQINLMPIEEFDSGSALVAEPAQETQDGTLIIHNVRPGQYRVHVLPAIGYAASVRSDGKDLLHEPLIVGMGGYISPIEITLRDDAAELTVAAEFSQSANRQKQDDAPRQLFVYVLPTEGGETQLNVLFVNWQNASASRQLRPGSYRVLVFDREQPGLDYADQETLKKFESKGQLLELTANQKEKVRATVIREDDSQ